MRSDKLSEERIGEILAILDELKASGASAEVFAQSRGVSYGQLRGWLSHAPRWRGQLAGQEVPARASGFVQARLSPQASAGTLANTRAYKKMPNCKSSWASVLVVDFRGIEVSFGKMRKAAGPCGILRDRKPAFDPIQQIVPGGFQWQVIEPTGHTAWLPAVSTSAEAALGLYRRRWPQRT